MNKICNKHKITKYFFGLCFVILLPVHALAEVSIWDAKDNIPPRAWIGRPAVTGPIARETINISSGEEVAYRTFYNEQQLIGDIVYENVAGNDNRNPLPEWRSPAGRLLARPWEERDIYTSKPKLNALREGISFEWSSLTQAQKNLLNSGARPGERIVNFTRGERAHERPYGSFRDRVGLLGEIVHSNLHLWRHTVAPGYSKSNPLTMLYVGANDGMLHAFDAKTGVEVFAYVPSTLLGNLKENVQLRAPGPIDGALPKPAYVDGQISIAPLYGLDKASGNSHLQTVLVGTLGAGGEGLYALDITDPHGGGDKASRAEKAKKIVKWEITSDTKGFHNMGRVYGAPRIGIVNENGKKTHVVVVGNGYFNDKNQTSLFVIDLKDGRLIKEFVAKDLNFIGAVTSLFKPSGLSTPTLHDQDANGVVDFAYAGDPDGRLWKFDLRDLSANATGENPKMLYRAKMFESEVVDGVRTRPITAPPVVHYNDDIDKDMVIFGTGMLVRPRQFPLFLNNRLYGIVDDDGRTIDDNQLAPSILRSGLPGDVFSDYRVVFDGRRLFKGKADNKDGWYLDLPERERVLGYLPISSSGRMYVTTNELALTGDNGPSWMYVLDMSRGLAPDGCSVFDLDRDGEYCQKLAGKEVVDHGDLMLGNRIEGRAVEAINKTIEKYTDLVVNVDFELMPRDRKPMAVRVKRGLVSQPTLLSDGAGTIFPIFNWNAGDAQKTIDMTKWQFLDRFKKLFTKNPRLEYSSTNNADGSITITATLVGEKRACAGVFRDCERREDVEQIKVEKDGTWLIKKRPDADGPFSNFRCFAHCDGDGLNKDVVGLVGNRVDTKWKIFVGPEDPPKLERKSWRVIEQ